ncbi:AAA family ATPase [Bacillus toyonensis]
MCFLTLFSRFNTITHEVSDNLLILIDEGDLYFHPQWQKDWLFTFINIISYLFQKTSIQIILTTHSPFILSDLPSGNVILLKKDDNKKYVQ